MRTRVRGINRNRREIGPRTLERVSGTLRSEPGGTAGVDRRRRPLGAPAERGRGAVVATWGCPSTAIASSRSRRSGRGPPVRPTPQSRCLGRRARAGCCPGRSPVAMSRSGPSRNVPSILSHVPTGRPLPVGTAAWGPERGDGASPPRRAPDRTATRTLRPRTPCPRSAFAHRPGHGLAAPGGRSAEKAAGAYRPGRGFLRPRSPRSGPLE